MKKKGIIIIWTNFLTDVYWFCAFVCFLCLFLFISILRKQQQQQQVEYYSSNSTFR